MNIPFKFGSNWPSGIREHLKQTAPFFAPLGLLVLLYTSNQQTFLEDDPIKIPTKFVSNWPSRFREED
jgi:hypothetical protein